MVNESDISVRGLQEGFESPLRKFKGKYVGYTEEPASGYEGTRVNFNFTQPLEVIQSTEPYNFPIVVINLGKSGKKRSKMGYLLQSIADLIPDNEDLKDQKEKVLGCVFCDGLEGRPAPKPIWNRDAGGEVPTSVWTVYEVEGTTAESKSGKSIQEIAEGILDGKSLAEFNKEILQRPEVQKDSKEAKEFQKAILDKSFVKALVQTKKFSMDENGTYKRNT